MQLREEQEMILRILDELRLSRNNDSYFSAVEIGSMVFPSRSQAGIMAAANLKSLRNKKLVNDIIIYEKTSAVCMWKISDSGSTPLWVIIWNINEIKRLKMCLPTLCFFLC